MGCSMETRTITSQFRPSMKCCWIVASQAPFGFLVRGASGKPKGTGKPKAMTQRALLCRLLDAFARSSVGVWGCLCN